jgi:HprK-related kinase B
VSKSISIERLALEARDKQPLPHKLELSLGGVGFAISSNSAALIQRLDDYLRSYTEPGRGTARFHLSAIQLSEPPRIDASFADWPREADKTGRKEEFYDTHDGRIIRKVRTGMQFLVSERELVALGDCEKNDNQVINFINTQYIRELLHRDYLLCHAAGLVSKDGRGLGMAGRSGGGKSTLMLHCMAKSPFSFCSNDRLLIRHESGTVDMQGVAKWPRINPGTAMNNPALAGILPPGRREALATLPLSELWSLEEKYDADIDRSFGPGRIKLAARLAGFLVLNWRHGEGPSQFNRFDPFERTDLLKLIAKSPGPFHWPALEPVELPDGGRLPPYQASLAAYAETLSRVPVYEATGGIDFERARAFCAELLQ